jgi:hypothetical protein
MALGSPGLLRGGDERLGMRTGSPIADSFGFDIGSLQSINEPYKIVCARLWMADDALTFPVDQKETCRVCFSLCDIHQPPLTLEQGRQVRSGTQFVVANSKSPV